MLTLLAFASVTALTSRSLIRGYSALALGLLIGFVGIDQLTGQSRLTLRRRPARQRDRHRDRRRRPVRGRRGAAHGEQAAATDGRRATSPIQPDEGHWMTRDDWRRSWKPWLRGAGLGFPFGALPAGGAEVPTFLSYADRAQADQAPGRVRPGRDRGRRGPGGRQQRVVLRHARPAAHARHPDLGDGGDHARRLPDLQPAAGAGAVRAQQRPGVDADRLALRRQRDAAAAQPAADPRLGEGARGPAAAALRGHPRVRHARRLLAVGQRRPRCS